MPITDSVRWKCPSNIALVKYWGKYARQYPRNASLSFTLDNAHSITNVEFEYDEKYDTGPQLHFLFENQSNSKFETKILAYLKSIADVYPIIRNLKLKVSSQNSFPHSSGIASSASGMGALALCLADIESKVSNTKSPDMQRVSMLARLGSGSASRSVFPYFSVWGESSFVEGSSNDYAIAYGDDFDPVFKGFHDDILIVSGKEKSVSSRAGHKLMENNPYAVPRFEQANQHIRILIDSMKSGDLEVFGSIVEKEALTLHALMMCSQPPYILMEPNTLSLIREIQNFRRTENIPVFFTLDAGPNIHMLYPDQYVKEINSFKSELKKYCFNGRIIEDKVGIGPIKLN